MKFACLVSGSGTILEACLKEGLRPAVVVADRACRGIEIADAAGITTAVINRRVFGYRKGIGEGWRRQGFTLAVIHTLLNYEAEAAFMMGFMTTLGRAIEEELPFTNTHPSLLPAFKGDHAVRDALAAGVKITGCTIHIATAELDAGPIIDQEAVRVLPDDTEETLHERIKVEERRLYPRVIRDIMEGRITL
jgi:phosphoribosylglycinamide formyltransferase 1